MATALADGSTLVRAEKKDKDWQGLDLSAICWVSSVAFGNIAPMHLLEERGQ